MPQVLTRGARQGPALGTEPLIPALIPTPVLTHCQADAQGLGFSACEERIIPTAHLPDRWGMKINLHLPSTVTMLSIIPSKH